jgi:hypothetical protein
MYVHYEEVWLASNTYRPRKVTNVLTAEGKEELYKFLGNVEDVLYLIEVTYIYFNIHIYFDVCTVHCWVMHRKPTMCTGFRQYIFY